MSDGPIHHLHRIPLGPKAVPDALSACRRFSEAETSEEARARLAIIVEELIFNLVDYSGAPPGDVIEITFTREIAGVRLVVIDGGGFFDPREAPAPEDLPPEHGGGAGLALVRAWSRIECYERRDGRNRLELFMAVDGGS